MMKFGMDRWVLAAVVAVTGLSGGMSVSADVVELADGRRFEGAILRRNDKEVKIDTVVATIRTQLTFTAAEVASAEKSELPANFFAPPQGAASTVDRAAFAPDATLYIEVPVVGVVGRDVQAVGVRRALAYAQRNAVQHVVFRVDSDGGSLDEMQAIVREMKRYEGILTMHALVSQCMGDALAVPMVCDTVTLVPHVVMGGSDSPMAEGADDLDSELEQTLRSDLGYRAAQASRIKGRPGAMIQAAIDPSEELAAWTDEAGLVVMGRRVPADVPAERVIVSVGPEELLVLDGVQLGKLGAPIHETDVAGLGGVLGYQGWTLESEYGATVMAGATDRVKQTLTREAQLKALEQQRSELEISRNIGRRKAADRTLRNAINQAGRWDPAEHSYATYQSSGRWGGRRYGSHRSDDDGARDTNRLTKQSRGEWRQRSDTAMGYLSQGAKAARSLKKLDAQAVTLGLEPTYAEGELDTIIQDLTAKWDFLSANRDKKNK